MTTKQLSDTQLTILSQAAKRDAGAVLPTPTSIKAKGAALINVLNAMVKRDLIEEVAAGRNDLEWQRDAEGQRLSLRITHAGLSAMGIEPDLLKQQNAVDQTDGKTEESEADGAPLDRACDVRKNEAAAQALASAQQPAPFRPGSKGAAVTALLQQPKGASIVELMSASGWQAHSVRGFLSGTLKKKHGFTVLSERIDGARRYRIGG